ncbi:MAG: UbiA family prenyltransferase [Acidobacteria bacterium]|nr:UbiA family prenyltransferase [Acidobacteriota bacterium]
MSVKPYLAIARADHWVKNAFMLLGVLLACFYRPAVVELASLRPLVLAIVATCLVASSNYVLNELLDGPRDRSHPEKRLRPVPSGEISLAVGYAEWLLLAAAGLSLAAMVGTMFAVSAASLWVMGIAYNVPPVRLKEWPYLDVLSESVNNPIRLALGWFALVPDRFPPVSLALSYWMVGAFFMAMKRLAELRHIGDRAVLAQYRHSFLHYTEERLLVSILFYASACALFGGIFIVRYRLELILFVPLLAGFLAYYFKIGMQPNSAAQHPEHLHRERGFVLYLVVCLAAFVLLMFTSIPWLYQWFNVEPVSITPLWTVGG